MICPCLAWSTILRATSEIAVAISVRSAPEKPSSIAKARPFWRAITMSDAEVIGTRVSLSMGQFSLVRAVKVGKSLFQIQRCANPLQRQPELHHCKRDIRLDADNHRLRPPQPKHVRDRPQRARGKRINDIE